MAQEFAKSFYKSSKWLKCRASYIKYRQSVDGGLCEDCKNQIGKIVHHKKEITQDNINNPDITLNFRNLKYVCTECHNIEEHGWFQDGVSGKIRYEFDEDGNVIEKVRRKK